MTRSHTPSKIATKTTWTDWRKKPLTAALVKLEQSGVLVNDAGEVSFWQRDVLFPICNRCSIMKGLQQIWTTQIGVSLL